jgi:hypothetical protein
LQRKLGSSVQRYFEKERDKMMFDRILVTLAAVAVAAIVIPTREAVAKHGAPKRVKWECTCVPGPGDSGFCPVFASINGQKFSFGAYETSGDGYYRVIHRKHEDVVEGNIRTTTGGRLTAVVVTPKGARVSKIYIDKKRPGEQFLARCTGRL